MYFKMVMSRTLVLACILVFVGTLLSIFRLPRSRTICRYALRLLSVSCEFWWIILRLYTFDAHIVVVDVLISICSFSEHASLFC